jgi:hypothetical protein
MIDVMRIARRILMYSCAVEDESRFDRNRK